MGSIRRHRRCESDCDSYQVYYGPIDDEVHDHLTFGDIPFASTRSFISRSWDNNSVQQIKAKQDFKEDEYPQMQYSEAYTFQFVSLI